MANSLPEKRRYTKDVKKNEVDEEKSEDKNGDETEVARKYDSDVEGTGKSGIDNDDSVLLSQAMDDEDWITPTQPDKTSFLPENVRESLLKPFDETPFDGNVYMLTQEINRLRKQLGDSLGERQMLTYKVKNLNRENALLQDNLIQMQQTFEQRFIEQKNDFEKTARDMQNVITYQEQDLRTKEFRDRLNNSASVATGHTEEAETNGGGPNNSPVFRLKKVSLPMFRRGNFPRNLNDSPMLRKAFAHCRLVLNDTFRAVESQGKSVDNAHSNQHDNNGSKNNRIMQTSLCPELQSSNPNLHNCTVYLRSDNQLSQLYCICDEIIKMNFRSIAPDALRNPDFKTMQRVHNVLAEPRRRWCR